MNENGLRNNSEFYFNLYQKLNKELIEEIIDKPLNVLLLEKYYFGQKIDVYGHVKGTTTEVFIESMIKKADNRHLNFILKLIDKIESKGIIIFQAESFSDKIIERILKKIKNTGKTIDFYAVEISKELITNIEELKNIHFLKVIDRVTKLDVSNPFNIIERYVGIKEHTIREKNKLEKLSKTEKRNQLLITEIREKLNYYPTVYREKRCLANRILSYSAGRSDINYFLSAEDREGEAFVYIQFTKETEWLYRKITMKEHVFKEKLGYSAIFDDDSMIIRTNLIDKRFIYKTIDDIVEIFERYVFYLSNYILYGGTNVEDIMWNQHKEGTL